MSNSFDSNLIPRILGAALMVLREECPLLAAMNHDFNGSAAERGSTVYIEVPDFSGSVSDVTPASTLPAPASSSPTSVPIAIDRWKKKDFFLTELEAKQIMAGIYASGQLASAVRILANYVNQDLLAQYKGIYGYTGTAGTNPFATNANPAADVAQVLDQQLCPRTERMLIVGSDEYTAGIKTADLKAAYAAGDPDALRKGLVGNLFGLDTRMDLNRPTHTAGTITTGLIAKASTVVAVGATSVVATTAASTGACALKKGDIITIGTTQVNPYGGTQLYVLTADATQASAATDVTLTISPPLAVALAGSEAITVKATHKVNIACDKYAFGIVARAPKELGAGLSELGSDFRPLGMPTTMVDPITGLPLTLTVYQQYKQVAWELSLSYGLALIDARRAGRLAG